MPRVVLGALLVVFSLPLGFPSPEWWGSEWVHPSEESVEMSYNFHQFRDMVARSLKRRGLYSEDALHLLLGTAAVESRFGTYLRQVRGPALGAFQVEPATFDWLQEKYQDRYPELAGRTSDEVEWDLDLAIFMARLRYRVVSKPLPSWKDTQSMARYWKAHYNTAAGAGHWKDFVERYGAFVVPYLEDK